MKIETIYNQLNDIINDDMDLTKAIKLKEKLEQVIREETCYKTTNKTRINAIKRVASKDETRPILTGYGLYKDYKVVTDSYHLIAIKEENMPLKLVTDDKDLIEKVGKENCIYGNYANVEAIIGFDKEEHNKLSLDYDDIAQFYKLHKKNHKEELYTINGRYYDITFLKNVVDVLGKNTKVYQHKDNEFRPLFIENDKKEIGIVLPVKKY